MLARATLRSSASKRGTPVAIDMKTPDAALVGVPVAFALRTYTVYDSYRLSKTHAKKARKYANKMIKQTLNQLVKQKNPSL